MGQNVMIICKLYMHYSACVFVFVYNIYLTYTHWQWWWCQHIIYNDIVYILFYVLFNFKCNVFSNIHINNNNINNSKKAKWGEKLFIIIILYYFSMCKAKNSFYIPLHSECPSNFSLTSLPTSYNITGIYIFNSYFIK